MLLLMLMMLRYRLELLDHPYLAQVNIVLRPLQEPGTACCSMVQPGTTWYSLVQPNTAGYSLVQPGTAWNSLVQPSTAM